MLVRKEGERVGDFPREPFEFFRKLLRGAKDGHTVNVGDVVRVGGAGLLGFPGLAFLDTQGAGGLVMIGLTEEEMKGHLEFGVQRVLSLMNKAEQFYPAPYWTERRRASRICMKDMEASILHTVTRIHNTGLSAYRESSRIVLRIRAGRRTDALLRTLREVPEDVPVALLAEMHPSCDGQLKWVPGQTVPAASTPAGSKATRLCGSFVVLRPDQPEDSARILEDGYVLALTPRRYKLLRKAILAQEDLVMPTCELAWIEDDDVPLPIPVEEFPAAMGTRRSWRKRIMLGQSQEQTNEAASPEWLMGLITSIEIAVAAVFSEDASVGKLRVGVRLKPMEMPIYQLDRKGQMNDAVMKRLWQELQILATFPVKSTIDFSVEFDIGVRTKEAKAGT